MSRAIRHLPSSWEALALDRAVAIFRAACEIDLMQSVPLGGDYPDYVGAGAAKKSCARRSRHRPRIRAGQKEIFLRSQPLGPHDQWKCHAKESDLALLDGTFWTDNELIDVRGGGKTAREIGHVPLSGADGMLEQFPPAGKGRRVLIHLNNTNPVLDETERRASRRARRRM